MSAAVALIALRKYNALQLEPELLRKVWLSFNNRSSYVIPCEHIYPDYSLSTLFIILLQGKIMLNLKTIFRVNRARKFPS